MTQVCDRSSGQCSCRPGFAGHKCNICPGGGAVHKYGELDRERQPETETEKKRRHRIERQRKSKTETERTQSDRKREYENSSKA